MRYSLNLACLIAAVLILGSCRSKETIAPQYEGEKLEKPPAGYSPPNGEMLPLSGENCCARFISEDKQIIFLSRNRARHAHWQVYVYDLDKKTDRRVTYHDGDDQGPTADRTGQWLYYASITDINKEDPLFLRESLGEKLPEPSPIGSRPLWQGLPFELYRSRKDGSLVGRLTKHQGYDGEAEVDASGENLFFSETRGTKTIISRLNLSTMRVSPLTEPGNSSDGEPSLSPDGRQMLWTRYASTSDTAEIWLANIQGRKAVKLIASGKLDRSPKWIDNDKILFSTNSFAEKNHEIALYDMSKKCLQRVTYALGQDLLPAISSDSKQLIVSSDRSGHWQLYLSKLNLPTCP